MLSRYESCIDAEIQQRAVEYLALSMKGAALMDILAEMPKFPERQVGILAQFLFFLIAMDMAEAPSFANVTSFDLLTMLTVTNIFVIVIIDKKS